MSSVSDDFSSYPDGTKLVDTSNWVYQQSTSQSDSIHVVSSGKDGPGSSYPVSVALNNVWIPDGPEYDVQADLHISSTPDSFTGILGRGQSNNPNYYLVQLDYSGLIQLFKVIEGGLTTLGTYSSGVGTFTVKLQIKDATKKVFVDGVERISSTDNSITTTGRAGIYGTGVGLGWTIDNFSATFTGATSYTKFISGSIPSSGVSLKKTKKDFESSVAASGIILKTPKKVLDGSITSLGIILKQVKKVVISSISPQGIVNKLTKKSFFEGSITTFGSILKKAKKSLQGTVQGVGDKGAGFFHSIVGSISMSGTVSTIKGLVKSQTGVGGFSNFLRFFKRRRFK